MTEEEYFRKNYPDYCYGNRLLSPYWDLFQDGVEFGERQSEKEIADLKETNAILSESASINHEDIEYKVSVIEQRNKRIAELKQQIEKMKCCANCRFGYCERSSECIDKDGNKYFHCWNEEKEKYCDVGKNGKYQCWELDD